MRRSGSAGMRLTGASANIYHIVIEITVLFVVSWIQISIYGDNNIR